MLEDLWRFFREEAWAIPQQARRLLVRPRSAGRIAQLHPVPVDWRAKLFVVYAVVTSIPSVEEASTEHAHAVEHGILRHRLASYEITG